jgi:hypothetical protein
VSDCVLEGEEGTINEKKEESIFLLLRKCLIRSAWQKQKKNELLLTSDNLFWQRENQV